MDEYKPINAVAALDCQSWGAKGGPDILEGGAGVWGMGVPQRGPGAEPQSGVWGTKSPRSRSILPK